MNNMIERSFWQHLPTGYVWAVEIENQKPVRCVGPLEARDVDQRLLKILDYSATYLRLLLAEWPLYVPYVVCSVCGDVVRPGAATAANGVEGRVHLRCSLMPPPMHGESVGAAVLVEATWQRHSRLRQTSRVLRRSSDRLQARCRATRSSYALPLVK
jgi:hypothetical protein